MQPRFAENLPRKVNQDEPPDAIIAVVIPCFNAAEQIQQTIDTLPGFVRHVIAVNDASTDHTAERLNALRSERVTVIHHDTNQGVGGAVLTGYRVAYELGAEIVVKLDADGQMDPAFILPLIDPILKGKANYTKGNRFLHANALKQMPLLRQMGNIGLSFLTKLASGYWNIFDPTNGYTALDVRLLPILNLDRIHRRYFFETSLLIELALHRAAVRDVYMPARYGAEKSSLSEWKSLWEFPPKLLAGTLRRIFVIYFLRDFTAVSFFLLSGISLAVIGAVWGIYHWIQSIQTGVAATTGTVMVAVLPAILGIQLLLQAGVMDIQNTPVEPLDDFELSGFPPYNNQHGPL